LNASDVMTPDPECLTRADSIRRAAELMRDLDVGILPVVDDHDTNRLAGVITDRDIAVRCVAEGFQEHHTVGDYMTSGFIARVEADADIADVLRSGGGRQRTRGLRPVRRASFSVDTRRALR
jgi:CBS domain-containing protein